MLGETITEFAYGAYHDGEQDFVDMNKALSEIIDDVMRTHLIDVILGCEIKPMSIDERSLTSLCRLSAARVVPGRKVEKGCSNQDGGVREYANSLLQLREESEGGCFRFAILSIMIEIPVLGRGDSATTILYA